MNQPTDTPLDQYESLIRLLVDVRLIDTRDHPLTTIGYCRSAADALERLLAEVRRLREREVELQADAERYRWLRARGVYRSDPPVVHVEWASYHAGRYIGSRQPTMELLDQAIDSARALASQKEQTR